MAKPTTTSSNPAVSLGAAGNGAAAAAAKPPPAKARICANCQCYVERRAGQGECYSRPPVLFPSGTQRSPRVAAGGWCVNDYKERA